MVAAHARRTVRRYARVMNNHFIATLALAAILGASSVPAVAAGYDGKLPLYPHGQVARGVGDMPAAALAAGVPYQQTTADSVSTVDAWYASHAPKACTRKAARGAVQYRCPGGSIVIQPHGETLISFVPAMPHF
jgi:hypothetical protein